MNPSTVGYLALAKTDTIGWRNNANSANLLLGIDGSNNLTFNGSVLGITSLTNTHILVGNASNLPTDVAMSGDATMANTGALTIANSAITNAKVSSSAAIALSKLATTTASKAIVSDSGGLLSPSSVTSTEVGYLSGVTSAIQTQIGALLPLAGGTMSGLINMASHKITSLTNGSSAGDAVAFNQIHLMQIPLFASEVVGGSTSSTSLVAMGATVTITITSASSKILILAIAPVSANTSSDSQSAILGIARGGTQLFAASASPARLITGGNSSTFATTLTLPYLDSPATTGPTTYQLMLASSGNVALMGGAIGAGISTYIIVAEVA